MKFSNPFKKKDTNVTKRVELSLPQLYRWFLYDSGLPDPNMATCCMSLPAISSEGLEIEKEMSKKRLEDMGVEELPFALFYSQIVGNIWALVELHAAGNHLGDDPEKDAAVANMAINYSGVAYTAIRGYLSARTAMKKLPAISANELEA